MSWYHLRLCRLENDFSIPQNGFRFNDRLVPTWPFAFTGFLYLDKIVAEFHGVSAIILEFFKQLICRAAIVPASQIFQDVAAQKASLVLIYMPTQQIPCTDAFQFKMLDILQQFINSLTECGDSFTGISTVDLIQQVIDGVISHCHSPRFLYLKMRGVFSWRCDPWPQCCTYC